MKHSYGLGLVDNELVDLEVVTGHFYPCLSFGIRCYVNHDIKKFCSWYPGTSQLQAFITLKKYSQLSLVEKSMCNPNL